MSNLSVKLVKEGLCKKYGKYMDKYFYEYGFTKEDMSKIHDEIQGKKKKEIFKIEGWRFADTAKYAQLKDQINSKYKIIRFEPKIPKSVVDEFAFKHSESQSGEGVFDIYFKSNLNFQVYVNKRVEKKTEEKPTNTERTKKTSPKTQKDQIKSFLDKNEAGDSGR